MAGFRLVRSGIFFGALALIAYLVVMFWPYLAASLVRGSSVTAWVHLATAPIAGRAPTALPLLGSTVGADGSLMKITNDLLDPAPIQTAEAGLAGARSRVAAASERLAAVRELDGQRRELMQRYAADYRAELDAEIAARETRIALLQAKAATATAMAERSRTISDSGYRSRDLHDDARIRVLEAEAEIAAERIAIERARRRRVASQEGIFREPDGSSSAWAYDDWRESKTEIKKANLDLNLARVTESEAEQVLASARETFQLKHQAPVKAPPGSTIRSIIIGSGATVDMGEPVAKWIDCSDLLVDAPVSDAALPLIPVGGRAEVVLEGEGKWRDARVVTVRGAAETIGAADLAAVAKGRGPGDAQVLLKLSADVREFGTCPVGRAAYVHFPHAGVVAVLLARLGLR
jgi:multidrug resistance efflux pump